MNIRPLIEKGIVADLLHDGSGSRRRAIVLLGGSEGGKTWSGAGVRRPVSQLLGLGYTFLSLAYFKSSDLPTTLENIPLEYFERAFALLLAQPEVLPGELAVIGISRGAEAALLLGSMNPNIKAIIALSPSSVVWHGIPEMGSDMRQAQKPAWTYQGNEIPFVPIELSAWNTGTLIKTLLFGELRKAYEKSLQNQMLVEQAVIPVEKISGAILLISGKRDNMWPATQMSEQMMARLVARGFSFPSKHIAYAAGHQSYLQRRACWDEIATFLKANYPPV